MSDPNFWSKVLKTEGGCWMWTGCIAANGYGNLVRGSRALKSHRYSWELVYGEIPVGRKVLHKCDVRACCNPEHLFLGTHQDNMEDMKSKGRASHGLNHVHLKLTPEQIAQIRKEGKTGSYQSIADRWKVSYPHIRRILLSLARK